MSPISSLASALRRGSAADSALRAQRCRPEVAGGVPARASDIKFVLSRRAPI